MKTRPFLVALVLAALSGCNGGADPAGVGSQAVINTTPGTMAFDTVGQAQPLAAKGHGLGGGNIDIGANELTFTSTNSAVATVAVAGSTGDTANATVTAVNFGTATIQVKIVSTSAFAGEEDVPVSVWPNGTWTGSVTQTGVCGASAAYGETLQIVVDASGKGTLTAVDTPGFNRQYQITIPSSPAAVTFSSTGTFQFLSTSVPGSINVTFNKTQVTYQETTNYGVCSATYQGVLMKQ